MTALLEEDLGEVDVIRVTLSNFGVINDPAKQPFFGCTVGILLQEKVQQ